MCIPLCGRRDDQRNADVPRRDVRAVEVRCPLPALVRLDVQGATRLGDGSYTEVVDNDCLIRVTATTEPNTPDIWAQLVWSTGAPTDQNNAVDVDRQTQGNRRVTVTLPGGRPGRTTLSVDIYLVDLTDLVFQLPVRLGGPRRWKAYESDGTARAVASTTPGRLDVWRQLRWDVGNAVATHPEQHDVALRPARDANITVSLGNVCVKTITATVHICVWPRLHIQREIFDSMDVHNDGVADFRNLFDKQWIEGRADPATNVAAAACQSILWYTAGTQISVQPRFRVTQHPTDQENVTIAGQAVIGGVTMRWDGGVVVNPADNMVQMGNTVSNVALPPGVRCEDAFTIHWYMLNEDGTAWIDAGSTSHLLYVALQAPTETWAYWTLLDASCRSAAGETTENGFVPAAFAALIGTTGDGNGLARKGDGVRLSYYRDGVNTSHDQAEPTVYTVHGILRRPDGTGRCGGWADLLRHMFRLHGVTAYNRVMDRGTGADDWRKRFLVKNVAFAGAGTSNAAPYTHSGTPGGGETIKQGGVAGQGKTNPQFDFGDHVVVWHNNLIYDPSYGLHGYATDLAYETAALDGLGTWEPAPYRHNYDFAGTPQHIPAANDAGFIEHATDGGASWGDIAAIYGTDADTLSDAPQNRAIISFMDMYPQPVDGIVYIPRNIATAAGHVMLRWAWG